MGYCHTPSQVLVEAEEYRRSDFHKLTQVRKVTLVSILCIRMYPLFGHELETSKQGKQTPTKL